MLGLVARDGTAASNVNPVAPREDGWQWTLLLTVVALATVTPLFLVEYLPITDLPEQVAVMATLRHWFDPAWRIQEHYVLALGDSQYLIYHFAGAALTFVVGSADTANRLLMASAGIAFPFALRALLRATGRDPRLAIFGCPLFWSRAVIVGFLPYVASVPLLLFLLALAVRQVSEPRPGRAVLLALLATVLFYVHASAFTLLAIIAPAMALASRLDSKPDAQKASFLRRALDALRPLPRRLWWLVPSALCAAGWAIFGRVTLHRESLTDDGEVARMSSLRSARAFTLWAHDIWTSHVDDWCAALFWALFLLLLVGRLRGDRAALRGARVLDPVYVPFCCTVALYFALPFRIGAAGMLNVRLAPVLAMFAIVALPARRMPWDKWISWAVAGIALVVSGNAAYEMHTMNRDEMAGFGQLIAKVRTGSRMVSLSFTIPSWRTHFPSWVHVGAYHRVEGGGVAAYSFSALRHWPLHYRPEAAPPAKPQTFWEFNPCVFRNGVDGPYYDYVLVRGPVDPFRDRPPGPVWQKVATAKDFTLYEKVSGEWYEPWPFPDAGPCASRDALARRAAAAAYTYP